MLMMVLFVKIATFACSEGRVRTVGGRDGGVWLWDNWCILAAAEAVNIKTKCAFSKRNGGCCFVRQEA
jgi:hypothetical protein